MQLVYIYCVVNTVNGKKYIGQTKYTPESRFIGHCSDALAGRKRRGLADAIRKYGMELFVVEQLTAVDSLEKANEMEKQMISFFDTLNSGYNMLPGGAGERKKGNPHTKTLEWKEKISKIKKDLWGNPEARAKMIEGRWGNYVPKKKYQPPCLSPEERSAKIKESNRRRAKTYRFLDPTGSVHETSHLPSFSQKHNLHSTCLVRVASGKYNSHKGWRAA